MISGFGVKSVIMADQLPTQELGAKLAAGFPRNKPESTGAPELAPTLQEREMEHHLKA
jgi:hypothetical protein